MDKVPCDKIVSIARNRNLQKRLIVGIWKTHAKGRGRDLLTDSFDVVEKHSNGVRVKSKARAPQHLLILREQSGVNA